MSAAVDGALLTTVIVAGPFLAVVMSVGMIVSLFQAVTQINEMTLSFVPKFLGTALVLALLGPWLLRQLERFAVQIWGGFGGCCHDHSGRAGSGRIGLGGMAPASALACGTDGVRPDPSDAGRSATAIRARSLLHL